MTDYTSENIWDEFTKMSKIESSMESLNDGLFDFFADASIFCKKISVFLAKIVLLFIARVWDLC